MRASDLRMVALATPGYPRRFVWVALSAGRGKLRLAAVLLHDGGYRTTSVMRSGGLGALALLRLLRLFRDSAEMFPDDPDEPMDTLRVFEDAFRPLPLPPSQLAPTASLRQKPRGSDAHSTVVTALLVPRDERPGVRRCRPTDAGAMRTVMTTTVRPDRTLVVSFWPAVGGWIDGHPDDVELRVWHRSPVGGRRHVDLLDAEEGSQDGKGSAYPRLCKMVTHAARDPAIVKKRHIDERGRRCPSRFEAVAEVSVQPDWPDVTYIGERERLRRLGRAHEVARRHDAAVRIQAAWREAVSCPGRLACRRRLMREFDELPGPCAAPGDISMRAAPAREGWEV